MTRSFLRKLCANFFQLFHKESWDFLIILTKLLEKILQRITMNNLKNKSCGSFPKIPTRGPWGITFNVSLKVFQKFTRIREENCRIKEAPNKQKRRRGDYSSSQLVSDNDIISKIFGGDKTEAEQVGTNPFRLEWIVTTNAGCYIVIIVARWLNNMKKKSSRIHIFRKNFWSNSGKVQTTTFEENFEGTFEKKNVRNFQA